MPGRTSVAALIVAALGTLAPIALAHEGNPNYRSTVETLEPEVPGVSAEVLNFDDSLTLENKSEETVLVEGYEGEPYVRILPDGTVEVNERSPATYLNEDRLGDVEVPAQADETASPQWRVVDRTGRFQWHDHRIHWMGEGLPPQVTDEQAATKLFDWEVPLEIGARPATLNGELVWDPVASDGGFPVGAAIGLGAIAVAGAALVLIVRRRRRRAPSGSLEAW